MDFEILVKRITPKLKGITYRLNGHFSFMSHDDLYQEALLHLWMDFQGNKFADKTDSYILQGCYFHLKNYIRKVQDKARLTSLEELSQEEGVRLEERLAEDNPIDCFCYLDSKILVENINTGRSTEREKQVLSLLGQGLTVREIGKRIGVSHVRVIKLKNRIRQRYAYLLE